ncbi:MAG: SHOCT domain-containing protein [Marinobacterium sp.]|nr:SHOCT domain-containing protein [Marinobacterium sp.]
MKKAFTYAATIVLLSGCAGSANHDILVSHQAQDSHLGCKQINDEMVRTQVVIDGVNADKADVSGADVVDGLLWFPFNLIAKNNNYNSAMEAAGKRMARLTELQDEKNCAASSTHNDTYRSMSKRLQELQQLYKDGIISAAEYTEAKRKAMGLAAN